MKGLLVNNRKTRPNDCVADKAQKALAEKAKEMTFVATEQRLEQKVESLQAALDYQIEKFPLAESALRAVTQPWIDKAQLALMTFRETCIPNGITTEEVIDQAKRLSWEQWTAIGESYPDLDIVQCHDYECALYDTALAEHQQKRAAHEAEQQTRISNIRNATLEGALGEVSIDGALGKIRDQL